MRSRPTTRVEEFWVAEQRHDGAQEAVWLLDWNGKVLHKLMTNAKDTSGMTFGDGFIWSGSVGKSIKGHGAVPTKKSPRPI